jgi:SAM-dependent methyltransferase
MTNHWTARATNPADAYTRHTATLRGALRHALVTRALLTHLPDQPQHIIDVGGGAGHQAIALARAGHQVTILDPDPDMLAQARAALAAEEHNLADRITLIPGRGEDAPSLLGHTTFDAACCHGVLMYLDDPAPLLHALTALVRPTGLISILTKNRRALAMRPALQQRWSQALTLIDTDIETGNLGLPSRAHDPNTIAAHLTNAGAHTITWYGVRVFTDHLADTPIGPDFDEVLAAEWAAGSREPYRQLGRLFHLLAQRA